MILHLLRHAEAEPLPPGGADADRRLTPRGQKTARAVARAMRNLDCTYDAILASPLPRAQETLTAVLQALPSQPKPVTTDALLPDASPGKLLEEILRTKSERVLLVGHQPQFGRFLSLLICGFTREIGIKKASLTEIEITEDATSIPVQLHWTLSAKLLRKFAR